MVSFINCESRKTVDFTNLIYVEVYPGEELSSFCKNNKYECIV